MTRSLGAVFVALALASFPALAQESAGPRAAKPSAKAAATAAAPMNLNTATAVQLETLPGIGARTAERIIEYRTKNGGFKKVEELMNVQGVGEKSFLKLKSLITVTPPKADRAVQQ
jgi:competence protein ComEA